MTTAQPELVQTYRPYRQTMLSVEQLARLNTLRPMRMVRDTIFLWFQIVLTWAAVAIWPHWWVVIIAVPVIGTRYYALFIIGHDGLHRRLFRDTTSNDAWNDALILGPIGAITRLNRINHIQHHGALALPHDPDRYKYASTDKQNFAALLYTATGLRYGLRALVNVFLPGQDGQQKETYRPRDLCILIGWQVALIGGLTRTIGWWAYPVLWLLPVYVFTFTADLLRVFLEHSYAEQDEKADTRNRLISYSSNAFERQFFAPMNMNHHAVHHLWPTIPYYNLPATDALTRRSSLERELLWRTSYSGYLIEYARQFPWRVPSGPSAPS